MSKKAKPIIKKDKRTLRCNFSQDELLAIGRELADHNNALAAIEDDKARVVSDFAARIKAKEADISIASNKISSGYEFRSVPVRITMHTPEPGKKQVVREDTGEVVGVEDMTQEEMQPELLEPEK